ncbi:hypothetical protein D3C76_1552350 [compost metagenome]
MNKDPAGSLFRTVGAGGADPVSLQKRPVEQRRDQLPHQPEAEQGEQAVAQAGEQIFTCPENNAPVAGSGRTRRVRQDGFCHHGSLAFNQGDATVIDIHQQ